MTLNQEEKVTDYPEKYIGWRRKKYFDRICDNDGECEPWIITYKFVDPNGQEKDNLPDR